MISSLETLNPFENLKLTDDDVFAAGGRLNTRLSWTPDWLWKSDANHKGRVVYGDKGLLPSPTPGENLQLFSYINSVQPFGDLQGVQQSCAVTTKAGFPRPFDGLESPESMNYEFDS
jgi:hypothetical protein